MLGFADVRALWHSYTVFTVIRSPYDRAASAYEYLWSRRLVRLRWLCSAGPDAVLCHLQLSGRCVRLAALCMAGQFL